MKRYTHGDSIITVADEKVNEAKIEIGGRTITFTGKDSKELGEFVRDCYALADNLGNLLAESKKANAEALAISSRCERLKQQISDLKHSDYDTESAFVYEAQVLNQALQQAISDRGAAEARASRATRTFALTCDDANAV